jgi:transcriptional regulator with XRE-family HTH domain
LGIGARYAEFLHSSIAQKVCIAQSLPWPDYQAMTNALHKVEVANRLRLAIEAIGSSQIDVCRELNISPSKLGNWLRGDNYPDPWFVKQFCDRYGVTSDWIYRGLASGAASGVAGALWRAAQASGQEELATGRQGRGASKK